MEPRCECCGLPIRLRRYIVESRCPACSQSITAQKAAATLTAYQRDLDEMPKFAEPSQFWPDDEQPPF